MNCVCSFNKIIFFKKLKFTSKENQKKKKYNTLHN